MKNPKKSSEDWVGRIMDSKPPPWFAALSTILVGLGIVLAVQRNPTIATILIVAVAIVIAVYTFIAAYAARNRTSSFLGPDNLPETEYITSASELLWIIDNETGTKARLEKTKRIMLLVPLILIKEFWWGDGKPPKHGDFTLTGAAQGIGRNFRQGSRRIVEIILDRQYAKGEELEYSYVKQLWDAFKSSTEWVETSIVSETNQLILAVVFPHTRVFKSAKAIRQIGDLGKEYSLNRIKSEEGDFRIELLEDGRSKLVWTIEKPTIGGTYTIEWDW
jgi:hypothetical protein